MNTDVVPTQFAPAELANVDDLNRQINYFQSIPLQCKVLDAVPGIVVVLNKYRQIVFANLALNNFVESIKENSPTGKRPGEVLHCVHALENAGGCGTTEFCSTCGAVRAILISQKGTVNVQECLISRNGDFHPLELSVSATPFMLNEETFTIFAVTDISHEKRRRALERIFFHDVLNTANGLSLYINLLEKVSPQEQDEFKSTMGIITNKLIDEIKAQRDLFSAENNEMKVIPSAIDSLKFLNEQCEIYRSLTFEENLNIRIDPNAAQVTLTSDPTILGRVLGNMIKNALEASQKDKTVTVGCNQQTDQVEFWVQNSTFMQRHVQLQMFKRSFSTKSPNRGLGTYSMKLLGEKSLHGKVDFISSLEEGTIFRLRLPIVFEEDKIAA
jgi:nitrogen fixation/metabolism regulation signal transduction histidine kinase